MPATFMRLDGLVVAGVLTDYSAAPLPPGPDWIAAPSPAPALGSTRNADGSFTAPAPVVPATVSPLQGMLALSGLPGREAGKTLADDLTAYCTAAGGNTLLAFQRAIEWRRDSALVANISAILGLSGPQMDALFVQAAAVAV